MTHTIRAWSTETPGLLWRGQTSNTKTGNIPTAYVREELYDAGCRGCPHYGQADDRPEDQRNKSGRRNVTCYAHNGRTRQGARGLNRRARQQPQQYTVEAAMTQRVISARYARLTAIGDLAAIHPDEVEHALTTIRAHGLTPIAYTARWALTAMQYLRGVALASVTSPTMAERAVAKGWKVARTVSADVFGQAVAAAEVNGLVHQTLNVNGIVHQALNVTVQTSAGLLIACPAQVSQLRGTPRVSCNDCGLCPAVQKMPTRAGIAFAEHGKHPRGRAWTRMVQAEQG